MSDQPSHIIYLALGTNLGDRSANLQAAINALPPAVGLLAQSPVYETPPWGFIDQPAFLNMVLRAETDLAPLALLSFIKHLETRLGRLPSILWGPRLIDMDILFYDDLILNTNKLVIPHPHLYERAFVLVPLSDLAPGLVHPLLGRTIRELLTDVDVDGVKPHGSND